MAGKGLFDPSLTAASWFDETQDSIAGWFDESLIDSTSISISQLYLRNTTTNGISIGGVACYDLITTAGSSADTAVVNTTLAGTEIQFTKTAGGSVAAFITGRVPAGGWTITSSDIALWLQESSLLNNVGGRYRLFKYSGGTETELGGSPFSDGVEITDTSANYAWVGNVTDTALAEDDRLLLRVYVENIGVMAIGTATLNFNGSAGVGGTPSYSKAQATVGNAANGVTTVTLGSTPTVGNLMVATYFSRAVTQTPPAGWSLALNQNNATEADNLSIYYRKVVGGDGTSYNWGDGTDDEAIQITEWACSAGWPTSPLDVTASTGRTTAVNSLSSGTTGTTVQADELTIAAIGLRNTNPTSPSWTNSFTAEAVVFGGLNGAGLMGAYHVENSIGTKTSTDTWTGTAETAMGIIATFKGNLTPAADSYLNVYPNITFKAEGASGVTGTATSSQAQTSNASGTYTPPAITGTATQSQAQTSAAAGTYTPSAVTGTASSSQAQTSATSGIYTPPAITGSSISSQSQTSSASGTFTLPAISGSVTSSQAQTSIATGTFTGSGFSGDITNSQAQTSIASGTITIPDIIGDASSSQAQSSAGQGVITSSTPPISTIIGGGIDHQKKRKKATLSDKPNQHLDQIIAKAFKAVFGELTDKKSPKTVQKQANKIVSQYTQEYRPKFDEIDWFAFNQDLEAVQRLFALYQREIANARQIAENKRIFDIIENDNVEFLLMH